jgi:3-methyladenine DNA glycosylase Tag
MPDIITNGLRVPPLLSIVHLGLTAASTAVAAAVAAVIQGLSSGFTSTSPPSLQQLHAVHAVISNHACSCFCVVTYVAFY